MTGDACGRQLPGRSNAGRSNGGRSSPPPRPMPAQSPVLEQDFDAESLYALRAAVAAHGSQAGLSEGRTEDFVLVVHELATNAIRHGAGRGRVRLWKTADAVRCEVTDDGAPGTGDRDAALWDLQPGHGLWLTRQVADQASLESAASGTVAAVTFRLAPRGRPVSFGLAQRFQDGCAIMTLTGELDLGSAGQFTAAVGDLIRATPGLRLVLDLSGLTLWDSTGLAALITAQGLIDADPAARMILAALPAHLIKRLCDTDHAARFTLASGTAQARQMVR